MREVTQRLLQTLRRDPELLREVFLELQKIKFGGAWEARTHLFGITVYERWGWDVMHNLCAVHPEQGKWRWSVYKGPNPNLIEANRIEGLADSLSDAFELADAMALTLNYVLL